jgi:hypothetical protein
MEVEHSCFQQVPPILTISSAICMVGSQNHSQILKTEIANPDSTRHLLSLNVPLGLSPGLQPPQPFFTVASVIMKGYGSQDHYQRSKTEIAPTH